MLSAPSIFLDDCAPWWTGTSLHSILCCVRCHCLTKHSCAIFSVIWLLSEAHNISTLWYADTLLFLLQIWKKEVKHFHRFRPSVYNIWLSTNAIWVRSKLCEEFIQRIQTKSLLSGLQRVNCHTLQHGHVYSMQHHSFSEWSLLFVIYISITNDCFFSLSLPNNRGRGHHFWVPPWTQILDIRSVRSVIQWLVNHAKLFKQTSWLWVWTCEKWVYVTVFSITPSIYICNTDDEGQGIYIWNSD